MRTNALPCSSLFRSQPRPLSALHFGAPKAGPFLASAPGFLERPKFIFAIQARLPPSPAIVQPASCSNPMLVTALLPTLRAAPPSIARPPDSCPPSYIPPAAPVAQVAPPPTPQPTPVPVNAPVPINAPVNPPTAPPPTGCLASAKPGPEFNCINGLWTATVVTSPALVIPEGWKSCRYRKRRVRRSRHS